MGQPQGQADTAHPPHSVENGGHTSLDPWSQLLSLADTRAGHPARIHRLRAFLCSEKVQRPLLNVPLGTGGQRSARCRSGSSSLLAAAAFLLQEQVQPLPASSGPGRALLRVSWVQRHISKHVWPGTDTAAKSHPECREHPLQHVSPGRAADAERLGQAEENHLSGIRGFNQHSCALHSPCCCWPHPPQKQSAGLGWAEAVCR